MSTFVRTFKRRKLFLDQLAVGNSISFAAAAAGGKTSNFTAWRKSDPNFAADWDEALEEGTDYIEDIATERAMKKSDSLMAMILKARRPEKYDRGSKLELSGGISVEGSRQKLLNKIARLQAEGMLLESRPEEEPPVPEKEVKAISSPREEASPVRTTPDRGRKRREAAGRS